MLTLLWPLVTLLLHTASCRCSAQLNPNFPRMRRIIVAAEITRLCLQHIDTKRSLGISVCVFYVYLFILRCLFSFCFVVFLHLSHTSASGGSRFVFSHGLLLWQFLLSCQENLNLRTFAFSRTAPPQIVSRWSSVQCMSEIGCCVSYF